MESPRVPAFTFGPLLIGAFLNTILYGVFLVQVYTYYQTYKKDAVWNRVLVIYLFIVETVNTAFIIGLVYEPLIINWGVESALIISPKLLPSDAVITAAISVPCQLYYAWRIRIMTSSYVFPIIITFCTFTSLTGAITTSVAVTLLPQFNKFSEFEWAVGLWLISGAVADVVITICLVWFLRKNKCGFNETDMIVNKIMLMTVQTGALTSIAAVADVLVFVTVPKSMIQFIWDFSISKLFSNSLLSTLNARAGWNQMVDQRKNPLSFIDASKLRSPFWDPEKQFQARDSSQSPFVTRIQFPSPTFSSNNSTLTPR